MNDDTRFCMFLLGISGFAVDMLGFYVDTSAGALSEKTLGYVQCVCL